MAISEKIELLGKNLYTDIPGELTLQAIPTSSELEYVSAEDFDSVMLEKVLPEAVKEDINFNNLLEIDYYWILRCLRILNYGPYLTTSTIVCPDCGAISQGEYRINLHTVDVVPIPETLTVNDIVIDRDNFISFTDDVHIKLLTIKDRMNAEKDNLFRTGENKRNNDLAKICYMIKQVGTQENMTPFDTSVFINKKLEPADYLILKSKIQEATDYGLRAGGKTTCPECKSQEGTFITYINARYFRPTLGDLQAWKLDRTAGRNNKDVSRAKTGKV